ncbi:abortive infection system antitoxin AbiGi family protein [Nocardia salmonicida]|uniref:abortive infection system antitoxin AbiGi family protein n=1 Tax=Nocardia salmonicida TaxID=53431 RepID=UPI003712FF92
MADRITELLHRRSDLSTFLVHFTRGDDDAEALKNLMGMLTDHAIEARTRYGMAAKLSHPTGAIAEKQRVVCFTDTPLEHCWMMVREIQGRGWKFQPYGIAFTKSYARARGCNPVWYINQTPGHDWLTRPLDRLYKAVEKQCADDPFLDPETLDILQIAPFLEQSGVGKDFFWEREWRFRGHFDFGGPPTSWPCLRQNVCISRCGHTSPISPQIGRTEMFPFSIQSGDWSRCW